MPKSPKKQLVICLGLIILYILLYFPLSWVISYSAIVLVVVPILVSAIYFGVWGGTTVALVIIPIDFLLFSTSQHFGAAPFFGRNFIFTHISFLTFGIIIGYMGALHLKLNQQVSMLKTSEIGREELIEQLTDALDNVRTLTGLLPICSGGKKIRDDQGYWERIESFIETHSDAEFSHGLCPECSDEIYGDQTWYQKFKETRKNRQKSGTQNPDK